MRRETIQVIGSYGGYRKTFAFGYTCLVYHATCTFCRRNYDHTNDALGKTVGQMVGAARSARQNIVEGSARAGTSRETELRLYDVAKGLLEELAGDYEAFLVECGETPWRADDPCAVKVRSLRLDRFMGDDAPNMRHDFGVHILAMRARFAEWLEAEDAVTAANAILLAIDQACRLLHRQMESLAADFREEGGFTERLSKARLETRDAQVAAQVAPSCPKCGKPMRKMIARKGRNAGNPFWSCTGYPDCDGTRNYMEDDET
mgnify:CR=1 FL=1